MLELGSCLDVIVEKTGFSIVAPFETVRLSIHVLTVLWKSNVEPFSCIGNTLEIARLAVHVCNQHSQCTVTLFSELVESARSAQSTFNIVSAVRMNSWHRRHRYTT